MPLNVYVMTITLKHTTEVLWTAGLVASLLKKVKVDM